MSGWVWVRCSRVVYSAMVHIQLVAQYERSADLAPSSLFSKKKIQTSDLRCLEQGLGLLELSCLRLSGLSSTVESTMAIARQQLAVKKCCEVYDLCAHAQPEKINDRMWDFLFEHLILGTNIQMLKYSFMP